MPKGVDDFRLVSLRYLVPALEEAAGIDGRAVDILTRVYGTLVFIQGFPVPVEYYWTTYPFIGRNNIEPTAIVWDADGRADAFDWRYDCDRVRWFVDGKNPCPVTGVGHPFNGWPAAWEYPQLLCGSCPDEVLQADEEGNDLWWY